MSSRFHNLNNNISSNVEEIFNQTSNDNQQGPNNQHKFHLEQSNLDFMGYSGGGGGAMSEESLTQSNGNLQYSGGDSYTLREYDPDLGQNFGFSRNKGSGLQGSTETQGMMSEKPFGASLGNKSGNSLQGAIFSGGGLEGFDNSAGLSNGSIQFQQWSNNYSGSAEGSGVDQNQLQVSGKLKFSIESSGGGEADQKGSLNQFFAPDNQNGGMDLNQSGFFNQNGFQNQSSIFGQNQQNQDLNSSNIFQQPLFSLQQPNPPQGDNPYTSTLFSTQTQNASQLGYQQPQDSYNNKSKQQKRGCRCKTSRCIKLYCKCFRNGVFCTPACSCINCLNVPENAEKIQKLRAILLKNRENEKASRNKSSKDSGKTGKRAGCCNCTKSFCQNNFCPCYKSGRGCTAGCTCYNCKNPYGRRPNANN